MASTECPKPTNRMIHVMWLNQVPLSQPSDSLFSGITPGCSGFGGNCTGARKTVIVHQMIRITTITVVMAIICNAFWLDSWMPCVFFHQK